ncbi:hypothetical protein [Caulobacter endophyticus]|nr:hypothetical protein [Caulobacter endophyticus]
MNIVRACKFLGPIRVSQTGWSREYDGEITHTEATTPKGEKLTAVEVHIFCKLLEAGPHVGERVRAESDAYCVGEIRFEDFHEQDHGWVFIAYDGDELASFIS